MVPLIREDLWGEKEQNNKTLHVSTLFWQNSSLLFFWNRKNNYSVTLFTEMFLWCFHRSPLVIKVWVSFFLNIVQNFTENTINIIIYLSTYRIIITNEFYVLCNFQGHEYTLAQILLNILIIVIKIFIYIYIY